MRLLIGWGVSIYAIVYLVWSALAIHGLGGTSLSRIVVLATLIGVTTLATRALGYRRERDVLPYAAGWMVLALALDAVFAVPYAGWQLYADWNTWVGYLLVLVVPLLVTMIPRRSES